MDIAEVLASAQNSLDVRRVYAEPFTQDGVTVIAAAAVAGGGGGGHGDDDTKGQRGEGGGFGVSARPVGAYVIKNGEVRWVPAVDVARVLSTATALTIASAFILRRRRLRRIVRRYRKVHSSTS